MLPSRREIYQKFEAAGYNLSIGKPGYVALKNHALPIIIDGTDKYKTHWSFKVKDVECFTIENAIRMSERNYDVWEGK